MQGARGARRPNCQSHLRSSGKRDQRRDREEAAVPFSPWYPGAVAGVLRLQRALLWVSELADLARQRAQRDGPPLGTLPEAAVALAKKHKLSGVAFTYNDPVVWIEYVHDVCAAFKQAGLYTAFITAGYMTEAALDYVAPVVEAFKFDLKAPDGARDGPGSPRSRTPHRRWPRRCVPKRSTAATWRWCPISCLGSTTTTRASRPWQGGCFDALGPKTPWHVTRFLPEFELSYLPPTPIKTLERAVVLGKARGSAVRVCGERPRTSGQGYHLSRRAVGPSSRGMSSGPRTYW